MTRKSYLASVLRFCGGLSVGTLMARVASLAVIGAATHEGGTRSAAIFGVATLLGTVLGFVTSFGLGPYVTRDLAAGLLNLQTVGSIFRFRIWSASAVFVAVVGVAAVMVDNNKVAFALIALSPVIDQSAEIAWAARRGLGQSGREASVSSGAGLACVLLAILSLAWGDGMGLTYAGGVWASTSLVRLVFASTIFRREQVGPWAPWALMGAVRSHLRRAVPYLASDLLGLVYLRGDTAILFLFVTTTSLGSYVAATALVNPVIQIGSTVSLGLMAFVTRRSRQSTDVSSEGGALVRAMACLGAVIGAGFLFFGEITARLIYGGSASGLLGVIAVLAFFVPLRFGNFALSAILLSEGRAKSRLVVVVMSMLLNVALNFALDPSFGILGAAWATVLTEVGVTILFLRELPSCFRRDALSTGAVTAVGALVVLATSSLVLGGMALLGAAALIGSKAWHSLEVVLSPSEKSLPERRVA